jgi:hypothetical protein
LSERGYFPHKFAINFTIHVRKVLMRMQIKY